MTTNNSLNIIQLIIKVNKWKVAIFIQIYIREHSKLASHYIYIHYYIHTHYNYTHTHTLYTYKSFNVQRNSSPMVHHKVLATYNLISP